MLRIIRKTESFALAGMTLVIAELEFGIRLEKILSFEIMSPKVPSSKSFRVSLVFS